MSNPARNRAPESSVSIALRVPPCRFRQSAGLEVADCVNPGRQNARDVGISFEHRGKPFFHHHGNFEIGPSLFQKMDGGSREDAIAERTQPDDSDAAAGIEPAESVGLSGHYGFIDVYSSIVASSISITGISSRTG